MTPYLAILRAGFRRQVTYRAALLGGLGTNLFFGVLGPYDKKPATVGNGSMVALNFDNRAQVDAFHALALELGGTCEGPPGERMPGAYFAYFRDLDGNMIGVAQPVP